VTPASINRRSAAITPADFRVLNAIIEPDAPFVEELRTRFPLIKVNRNGTDSVLISLLVVALVLKSAGVLVIANS
jgi:hypothetical protein